MIILEGDGISIIEIYRRKTLCSWKHVSKVKAAVDFIQSKENRTVIFTSLENEKRATQGKTAATIYIDRNIKF